MMDKFLSFCINLHDTKYSRRAVRNSEQNKFRKFRDDSKTHLTRDTSRDNNNLHTIESFIELVGSVAFHLYVNNVFNIMKIQFEEIALTSLGVSIWLTSAATPGAPRISYKLKDDTCGSVLSNSDSGCPIPPPAPRTATLW